jgi:hypothetical protein
VTTFCLAVPLSVLMTSPPSPPRLLLPSTDVHRTQGAGSPHLPLIQRLGSQLHLAPHWVGDAQGELCEVCLSADVEVHQSTVDPRTIFCIDTARLMPPMAPSANLQDIFSKLFRPEFMARHDEPLSSDAFSRFGLIDMEQHNGAVHRATAALDAYIVKTATALSADDALNLTVFLQEQGINLRFIGRVRTHCRDERVRAVLLREMVARVAQKRLRAGKYPIQRFRFLCLSCRTCCFSPCEMQCRMWLSMQETTTLSTLLTSHHFCVVFFVVIRRVASRVRGPLSSARAADGAGTAQRNSSGPVER